MKKHFVILFLGLADIFSWRPVAFALPRFLFSRVVWALLFVLTCLTPGLSQNFAGVLTQHNDNGRTGQNLQETILTPQNVSSSTFGKLFSYSVDGQIYAQPLYVPNVNILNQGIHNVLYVVTQNDSVYAFDANGLSSAALWQDSFINPAAGVTPVACGATGNGGVSCASYPVYGIMATPVIDITTNTMYLVARTYENGAGVQRLHALDITSGAEKFGGPAVIAASVPGTGAGHTQANIINFDPLFDTQRTGLLLLNGTVYIGWAGAYHGWIMGYDAQTLTQVAAFSTTPNAEIGGVWASGNGLAADSLGNIYAAVGDATFDANTGGVDYGDSVLQLNGSLQVLDYFTPMDQACRGAEDKDLGSGGPMLFPAQSGPVPDELMVAGKAGCDGPNYNPIYLLNTANLGQYNANQDQSVEEIAGSVGGYFSSPAYWQSATGANVYLGGRVSASAGDYLKVFALTNGELSTAPVAQTPNIFTMGATPSISANGTSNGIMWAIERQDTLTALPGTKPAILYAYSASNISTMLYNSAQEPERDQGGCGNKFQVPTIANGMVYVATENEVDAFGLLPDNPAPSVYLSSPCELFATQPQGTTGSPINVVLTNAGNSQTTPLEIGSVTITGTNAGDFAQTNHCGALTNGASCTIAITFTPSLADPETAYVTIVDNAVGSPHNVYLIGVGEAATVVTWTQPASITYGTALSGTQLNATANVSGTFVYTPAAGTILTAGNQTLSVTFTPSNNTVYQPVTKTVVLQVNPASTVTTWAAPAPIAYGTALGATQLNAQANVPGTFSYSPAIGVVPGAGSQALSVSFTPTDSTDYSSSSAGVILQVNPSGLTVAAGSAYGTYGQPLPPLTYTITGFVNGDTQSSATSGAPSEGTAASPIATPGVYPIAVSQGSLAAANYNFMSFLNGTVTMQQAASTVAATSQNSSISPNQSTTLTATVSVTGAGAAPTQTVNFMLGATLLGTATLSPIDSTDSTATFTLNGSQLSDGGNGITAVYSGDANYAGSTSAAITVTLLSSQGNFGSVGVGTAASVETLVYNFTNATTLSAVNILTAGASGLDYTDGGSSNCTAGTAYSGGQSCVVTVAFTPSVPGLRSGGVTLFAQGSNLPLATWYLSGVGQSSAVTIDPGTQSAIATLSNNGQGYGSAIDGAGNVYVVDHVNSQVIELSAGSFAQSVVVSSSDGLSGPTAVALDGAGNLYVSDTGNARVVMVPNEQGTLNSADMSAVNLSGLGSPRGLATDSSGNLYVADAGSGEVIELPAGGGAPLTPVSGLTSPHGIAVDAAGNLYVAGNNQVAEYPVSGGTPLPMGSGYNDPRGVTLDASGALYVADSGNARIVRVAAGGAAQSSLAIAGLTNPQGVALDAAGNVYVTDTGSVYEVNRAQAAPLVFGNTNVGSNSAPQTVTVSDAGNQPLNVSNLAISMNFTQLPSGGTDCTSSTQLSSGGQCLVAVAFSPTISGALSGTLTLSDNALNNPASTQTVLLSGSGAQSTQAITFPIVAPQTYGGSPVALTATASSGLPVSYTVTAGPATVTGNLLTITGAGAVTVQASQAGNAGYAPATPISQSFTVGQGATTVVWSNPAAIAYGTALNATQLNATATPISAGTYVYTPPAGAVLNAGSQTLSVLFTPTDSTDYSPSSGSVTLQVNQASQTVTFPTIPAQTYGVGPITLSATANSGLAVSYAVTSGPATVSGNLLTITGAGAVTVQATQAGNADYAAALPVSQTFIVNQATQTITFTESAPASAPYNSSFTVAASASSALPVAFSSSGACTNVGATFTMTNSTGTCTVTASQSGNNNYRAASTVIQSTTAAKAAQSVTFTGAPATAPYQSSFAVTATSNSGVAATITASGVCSISGATVTMTSGSGTCTVTAKWVGTTYFLAASAVQSTTAAKATPIVAFTGAPTTAPYQSSFAVTATSNSGVAATITVSGVCSISGATVTMSSGSGTCTATAKWAATAYYLAASAPQSTTAEKLPSTVTWAIPTPITYGTALSGTQLNATANVAGSFAYSPRAGTVLGAGNQTLSVTLTPTLIQDYATATVNVTLTVNKTGTTTAVTSNSPNPSSAGKAVKVQFAVTPASGYGHPTGNVTVNASTGESCMATLTATGGSCSVTFKSEGSRTLTATYAGDSNDNTSVSAAVTQTVN